MKAEQKFEDVFVSGKTYDVYTDRCKTIGKAELIRFFYYRGFPQFEYRIRPYLSTSCSVHAFINNMVDKPNIKNVPSDMVIYI